MIETLVDAKIMPNIIVDVTQINLLSVYYLMLLSLLKQLGTTSSKSNVYFRALPELALPSPQFELLSPLFSEVKNNVLCVE